MAGPIDDDFESQAAMFAAEPEPVSPEPEPAPWDEPTEPESIPEPEPETVDDGEKGVDEPDFDPISADQALVAKIRAKLEEEARVIHKPILFRASEEPRYGEVETVEEGVAIHVKYEFEFSSTLAGKNMDPYTPHIEVDLTMPSMKITVINKMPDGKAVIRGLSERELAALEHENHRRLASAASTANRIALDGLASLIVADKVRSARS